jgi:hypothetical protein
MNRYRYGLLFVYCLRSTPHDRKYKCIFPGYQISNLLRAALLFVDGGALVLQHGRALPLVHGGALVLEGRRALLLRHGGALVPQRGAALLLRHGGALILEGGAALLLCDGGALVPQHGGALRLCASKLRLLSYLIQNEKNVCSIYKTFMLKRMNIANLSSVD